MSMLQVKNLVKTYQQGDIAVQALRGVNVNVDRGEFTAMVGPSGSGKTTLLNQIGGLDQPTSGEIILDGQPMSALNRKQLTRLRLWKIGFIFQEYNLVPVLTALENVEYVMMLQDVKAAERHARARAILAEVGLGGMENRRPAELSGGQVKNQQGITGYASRVEGTAMLSAGEQTRAVNVFGVDPEQEPKVTRIAKSLIAGHWFDGKQDNEIILGAATQTAFKLKLGDEVVLVTQAADGSLGADRYCIQGFFSTGIEQMDRQLAFIPLTAAQSLFALEGRFTTLAIHVADRQQVPEITQSLRQQSGKNVEVYDWKTLLPSMVQMIAFHDAVTYVVLLVVFVVVAAGITNTILMSVMERTREFGMLMALGTLSRQVMIIILLESMMLGLFGLFFGALMGGGITAYYHWTGIDLSAFVASMSTIPGMIETVMPVLILDHVIWPTIMLFFAGIAVSLYPAFKAATLQPVEAMRHG